MRLQSAIAILLSALATACTPVPAPAPQPDRTTEYVETCQAIWQQELGRAIDEPALADCLARARAGVTGETIRTTVQASTEYAERQARLKVEADAAAEAAKHVDPTTFTLDELKGKLRGSLSVRLNLPYGPRPNQDSNIAWMPFYELYPKADRLRMLGAFRSRGLTMSAIGPVTGNDCYHEQFPNIGDPPGGGLLPGCLHNWRVPTQAEWDAYLDGVQEQWDGALMPCYFGKPDGWERPEYAAAMDALDALYRQPRAQKLLRCVVYPGWEPSGEKYGWPNREYVRWVRRGSAVFPNALRGIHFVTDLDAPTGQNDDVTFPAGQGNALSWVNVAPDIHFFADQLGGYVYGGTEQPSATFLDELCKHVKRVGGGFRGGFGWPSAGADGTRILHIVFEYAAFVDWWKNFAERYSWQIGDEAMRCGADGYGDGGTVAVRR